MGHVPTEGTNIHGSHGTIRYKVGVKAHVCFWKWHKKTTTNNQKQVRKQTHTHTEKWNSTGKNNNKNYHPLKDEIT